MLEDALVPISLDGYVAFFGVLAVITGLLFWFVHRKEMKARADYFKEFEISQLKMSPYKIGLVFRVVAIEGNEVVVVPVWDGKSKIVGGKRQLVALDNLIPFDESRFF